MNIFKAVIFHAAFLAVISVLPFALSQSDVTAAEKPASPAVTTGKSSSKPGTETRSSTTGEPTTTEHKAHLSDCDKLGFNNEPTCNGECTVNETCKAIAYNCYDCRGLNDSSATTHSFTVFTTTQPPKAAKSVSNLILLIVFAVLVPIVFVICVAACCIYLMKRKGKSGFGGSRSHTTSCCEPIAIQYNQHSLANPYANDGYTTSAEETTPTSITLPPPPYTYDPEDGMANGSPRWQSQGEQPPVYNSVVTKSTANE